MNVPVLKIEQFEWQLCVQFNKLNVCLVSRFRSAKQEGQFSHNSNQPSTMWCKKDKFQTDLLIIGKITLIWKNVIIAIHRTGNRYAATLNKLTSNIFKSEHHLRHRLLLAAISVQSAVAPVPQVWHSQETYKRFSPCAKQLK